MNNILKPKILLESGTNELELMEFTIAGNHFGINVAKILEIMKYTETTAMPNCSPYVEGVFKPRDEIMTVIDLATYMDLPATEDPSRDIFIITIFNNVYTAFHVHSVEEIHRISWENIEKPDTTIYSGEKGGSRHGPQAVLPDLPADLPHLHLEGAGMPKLERR